MHLSLEKLHGGLVLSKLSGNDDTIHISSSSTPDVHGIIETSLIMKTNEPERKLDLYLRSSDKLVLVRLLSLDTEPLESDIKMKEITIRPPTIVKRPPAKVHYFGGYKEHTEGNQST